MAQTSTLQVLSPCKINLFLYVLGKRPDGFHDLQSLFCLLNYGDTMDFTVEHDTGKAINLPNTMGFALEDNLIYKAAKLLQTEAGLNASVTVNVSKRLPMGGGLGGGSSNAATTLLVLNALCNLGLNTEQLLELGARLGSDVPFFIQGHNAFVEGRGEHLHNVDLPERYYLVVTPLCHVSTKDVFTDPELPQYFSPKRELSELLVTPFANDCVTIVRKKFPEIGQTLDRLLKYGSPAMSGTGASCFCAFDSREAAEQAQREIAALADLSVSSFVASSCNSSPVLAAIRASLSAI